MRLTYDGAYVDFTNPLWGYAVDFGMNVHVTRLANGKYRLFDAGAALDSTACKFRLQAHKYPMGLLSAYIRTEWRGATVSLELGSTPTGFYPAGPKFGDVGTFTGTITESDPSGWLQSPWGYVERGIVFNVVGTPASAYTPPAQVSEGSFQIGSVSGLKWPDPGFSPVTEYGNGYNVSRSGLAYCEDNGRGRDTWTAEWVQLCNQSKACALDAFLRGSGRGANTTILSPVNGYLFGTDNAESDGHGEYVTNLINGNESGTVLTWKHIRFNHWEIPLKYWMQSFVQELS
jgi:hypothetical protein